METTLNMNADILEIIIHAARSRGITKSEMIVFLMKKSMEDVPDVIPMGKMIRYQERQSFCEYKVVHVRVSEYEYEYMVDLRKLLKMSVSLICAYAAQKYLKKPMKKQIADNYPFFVNYTVAKVVIDNIISWRIIWGFPPDINKFI